MNIVINRKRYRMSGIFVWALIGVFLASNAQHNCMFDWRMIGCSPEEMVVIETFKTKYATDIAVLKNTKGHKFIVKQESRAEPYLQMSVARDSVGSWVAFSAGIPANRVVIIPAYCSFPGKKHLHLPATLHNFVPGTIVTKLTDPLRQYKVRIQQFMMVDRIPEKEWGLTRAVIQNMSFHPDLPVIVALDTFLGNADRHQGNFFYDPASNRFTAIDLESSFEKDLAIYACRNIKAMNKNTHEVLTVKELKGLKIYRDVLKKLIRKHTPQKLHKMIVEAAYGGGVLIRKAANIKEKLERYEENMQKNYSSCKRLVGLLDRLIKMHSKQELDSK